MKFGAEARCILVGLMTVGVVVGCGKKKSTDESTTSSTSVSSLSLLPDVSTILQSSSSTLTGDSDAVTGTPPKFAEIGTSDITTTKTNLEKYLSGDIATIITDLTAAKGNWTTAKPIVDKFREGQAKCQVIADAARSLQEMSERTTSSCMMGKIGKAGIDAMTYVSGTKVTDGSFFTPEDTDVVRQLSIGGFGLEGADTIILNIQGKNTEAGVFQIKLNFCSAGKSQGYDKIRVDNNAGTITFTTLHSGSEKRDSQTMTFKSNAVITASLKASGDAYVFDSDKARQMTIQNYNSSGTSTNSMEGLIKISGDTLSSKLFMTGTFSNNGTSMTMSSKSYGEAQFTGSNFTDATIYQGAGRRVGTFNDGTASNSMDQSVGFEFDNTATPQYKTITSSTYITNVAALAFESDAILSKAAPGVADVTSMVDTDCSQTPASVYKMNQNAATKAAKTACDNNFHGGDRLCDGLRDQENKVWNVLRSTSGSGAK